MTTITRNLILSLLIIAGYVITRFCIYLAIPIVNISDWFVRDTLMDIPRLAASLVTLYFGYKVWGWHKLGFNRKGMVLALGVGIPLVLTEFLFCIFGNTPFKLSASSLVIFCFSSFVVGFFEEILFRGALLNALRDWKGDFYAIWISSFLFAIYHIQAQHFCSWFGIFATGFIMANLRLKGVSILWLIATHGLIDCAMGLVGRDMDVAMIPLHDLIIGGVAVCLTIYIRFYTVPPCNSSQFR